MVFHVTLDRDDPDWVVAQCQRSPGVSRNAG